MIGVILLSTEVESYIKNTLVLENKYNGLMTFKKFIINFRYSDYLVESKSLTLYQNIK